MGATKREQITSFVAKVKRRLFWSSYLGVISLFALVGGLAFFSVLVLATRYPSGFWRECAQTLGILLPIGFVWSAMWFYRRWADSRTAVRFVGARVPADLMSAYELGHRTRTSSSYTSEELVEELESRVAQTLSTIAPGRLVTVGPGGRRLLITVLMLFSLFQLTHLLRPGLLRRGWAELLIPPHERFELSEKPLVGDLTLTLKFPEYTKLETRRIPSSSGDLHVLEGTEVTLSARSLEGRPREGWIWIEGEGNTPVEKRVVPLEVKPDKTVTAKFVVERSGAYRVVLNLGGRRVGERKAHRIDMEVDQAPKVELYAPQEHLVLPAPRPVELGYLVEDDFGLGSAAIAWRSGKAEGRLEIPLGAVNIRGANGRFTFDLLQISSTELGKELVYFLEAKDNDALHGPKTSRSREFTITIGNDKAAKAEASYDVLLEQTLTTLAARLEGAQEAARHTETLLGELKKDLAAAPAPPWKKLMSEMQQRITALMKKGAAAPKQLHVTELENDALAIDDLLGKQRLEELLKIGDEMVQIKDRLKNLMQEYKRAPSEELKQQLLREVQRLAQRMRELQARAAQLSTEMPDQFISKEALGKNDVGKQLKSLDELIAKGDIDAAMKELDRLSSSLDRMMASMENDLKGYRGERFSEDEKAMAEMENAVTDLEHDERELAQETKDIEERSQNAAGERAKQLVKNLQKEADALKKELKSVDRNNMPRSLRDDLDGARKRADELGQLLELRDFDESLQAARRLGQSTEMLSDEMKNPWTGGAKDAPKLHNASEHARKIAQALDNMPPPSESMSPEDRKKAKQLGERQAGVRKRTQQLQEKLDGRTESFRGGLGEAAGNMQKAERNLERSAPKSARGDEEAAADKLKQMKQQIEQSRRPRDEGNGARSSDEKVRIPGAEEYRSGKLREKVMDAMKREKPQGYEEPVKHYYEELVK